MLAMSNSAVDMQAKVDKSSMPYDGGRSRSRSPVDRKAKVAKSSMPNDDGSVTKVGQDDRLLNVATGFRTPEWARSMSPPPPMSKHKRCLKRCRSYRHSLADAPRVKPRCSFRAQHDKRCPAHLCDPCFREEWFGSPADYMKQAR